MLLSIRDAKGADSSSKMLQQAIYIGSSKMLMELQQRRKEGEVDAVEKIRIAHERHVRGDYDPDQVRRDLEGGLL